MKITLVFVKNTHSLTIKIANILNPQRLNRVHYSLPARLSRFLLISMTFSHMRMWDSSFFQNIQVCAPVISVKCSGADLFPDIAKLKMSP